MAKPKVKVEETVRIEVRKSNKENPDKDKRWIVREIRTKTEVIEMTIFRASSRDKCRAWVRAEKESLEAHDKGG